MPVYAHFYINILQISVDFLSLVVYTFLILKDIAKLLLKGDTNLFSRIWVSPFLSLIYQQT